MGDLGAGGIAAILVGLMFVVAGGSKFAAAEAWPEQASRLRTPSLLVPVVPWFEVILGALLVAQVARPVTAAVAAATLLVFTAVLLRALERGERAPCACFGRFSNRPLGAGHVIRNLVLLVGCAVAMLW